MPNPRLGYLLVALSAACSALNGSLARYLLDDGMSAVRLSQLRSAVSFVLLLVGLVHDQTLAATQIAGGVVVLAAITWVQTHRPSRSLGEWTSSSPEATGRSPVAS